MTERLIRSFDAYVMGMEMDDPDLWQHLRDMEIDIAVDLKGYTAEGRPGIFAHRPAPVQAQYLGFPGTMGMAGMDYIIADTEILPARLEPHYSEKVVRLSGSYQVNDRQRRIAEHTPSRAEAGLPETGFVFCSFNNNYKIRPAIFDVWMRLLKHVDGSVLWLLQDNPAAVANLRREAETRGVAPSRLVFAPRVKLADHLARQRLADQIGRASCRERV